MNGVREATAHAAASATNGVVIATEKKVSSLLIEEQTLEKVSVVCKNLGVVYSGMGPDARLLVRKARKAAQAYKRVYNEYPPASFLVREVASVMQEYTQSGCVVAHVARTQAHLMRAVRSGVRPFGVSLLLAGYDHDGPALYQVDPSGAYFAWKATALGKNTVNGKAFLEKRYNEEMELEDAVHTAILTLKEGFEGKMTENNIEIGIIGGADKETFRVLTPAEVRDYLANI